MSGPARKWKAMIVDDEELARLRRLTDHQRRGLERTPPHLTTPKQLNQNSA